MSRTSSIAMALNLNPPIATGYKTAGRHKVSSMNSRSRQHIISGVLIILVFLVVMGSLL
ncbi:hypothetical protein [Cutibacterium modestum]|uniref:hypothetical protein n=1 Tax=Cutibacterium modestum TaxID=2559073 RepID=UPI001D0C25F5|nr:hypothetical protein [Cutibacterium modestum]